MKHTPEIVETLHYGEIFVFGSNESGYHGAGAARLAADRFGAKMGQGFGMAGNTFAIPTKDWDIQTLPLNVVAMYVARFIAFAKMNPKKTFLVTKIGTGLAGLKIEDIAPMFQEAMKSGNIVLPKDFHDFLTEELRLTRE